jgi:chorismate dehydratase
MGELGYGDDLPSVPKGKSTAGERRGDRLRLGHIIYSNCFPVHARLLDQPRPADPELVEGVPSALNRLLARGEIDVAPASSIEYALHADRYRLLPELVIGSRGAVGSIVLASTVPPDRLGGKVVGLPTASATSVVLLKILLRHRWGVDVDFWWFDQGDGDPGTDFAASLFIGDAALDAALATRWPIRLDLGLEWWDETRLPFAFALWQAGPSGDDDRLRALHATLLESRDFGERKRPCLADRYSSAFRLPATVLERYWADLVYRLDDSMLEGLSAFFELAVSIGEITRVPPLRWIE